MEIRSVNKKSLRPKIRKTIQKQISDLKQKTHFILVIFVIIDLLILSLDFIFIPPLKVGDTAPKDIIATRTVIYRDEEETERIKNLILSQFKPIYSIDQNITLQVLTRLSEIFISNSKHPEIYRYFSSFPLSTINTLRKRIENWIIENYTMGIKEEEVNNKKQEFVKYLVNDLKIPQYVAIELSNYLIMPNAFINLKETETQKSELARS
ncbi:MAG: phosphohydrolase, partial [Dictyoglomus sp.]